ncbi:MAG: TrbI/VirB10 family protein [Gammaproteobacteria bacterium]|nr:TrbI/VirB10 family protein [Gammaproteobacteria bacterium]
MALKLPGFLTRTDTKSRIILVAGTIFGVSVLIFLGSRYLSGAKTSSAAHVASAPSGLQSVPGSQLSPEYYRALMQANAQSAKQAQISGGSAVPTLVNVPGQQQPTFNQAGNCTVMCPGGDTADVKDDISGLLKSGRLSQDEANALLAMAKNNVSVDQYTDALDNLVRSGKLTPEQARKLLETYKKQHANALLTGSAEVMDGLIKSGKLPLDAGTELLALQKQNVTAAQYAAELNRLVREGKISPSVAAQLLAQYTQQAAQELARENAYRLTQMAKGGQITQDVAQDLTGLQKRNTPVSQYAAELSRLVAAGKMTPATAAKLLQQYQQQRSGGGPGDDINGMVSAAEAECAANINNMVSQNKLTQDIANGLSELSKKNVSTQEYYATLNQLVQAGKLTSASAQSLMACYQKLHDLRTEAEKLLTMQGNNASAADYANELKVAVTSGAMSPDMAARLQQEYQAMVTPIGPGVAASAETNIPGAEDFAKLQQRLQQQQTPQATPAAGPGDNSQQFSNAIAQQEADEEARRQQRIQDLMTGMSGQAQSLVAAWQPPTMAHRAGSYSDDKAAGGKGGDSAGASRSSSSTTTTTATADTSGTPLIKAGTIFFAILETAVNSDYPDTPVMATIIAGKFKGAKLLGKLSLAQGQDKVSLNFNLIDMENWPKTKSVSAFAIDPDTARTVLATNVDYHYLLRYGSIIGTSFLTGYSSAITNAGTSATTLTGMTSTHPSLSPTSKIAVGLGQVGTTLGTAVSNYVNTPNTVQVNAGVSIGILFMSDVT